MLLADLHDLYNELIAADPPRLLPSGFQKRRVRLLIELDASGRCIGATDAGRDGPELPVPALARAGPNPPASIVADNGQYVLGLAQRAEPKEQKKALRAHDAYMNRLHEAADALAGAGTVAAQLAAVQHFLHDIESARAALAARAVSFEPGPDGAFPHASAIVRFRVDGSDPTDHPSLREWWAQTVDAELGSGEDGTCQVTRQVQQVARLMPAVKRIGGTQPKLISSNFDSALRYGARQSSGSQIGVATAVRTHQALNWLLEDPGHHRRMGGLTFVWWVHDDLDFDPFTPVLDPSDAVDQMLGAAWRGKRAADSKATFRLLALSVNEARVVVRLDHTSALEDLRQRIDRWLDLVEVPRKGGVTWRVPIGGLADSAIGPGSGHARQAQRDRVVADLAVALVTGRGVSERVRNAAVLRCRAERSVPPARAALLNICQNLREAYMSDEQSTASELCGRLLAQLEQAQWAALGDVNRTVTDRYYAKASVSPEQVFPQLLRGAQAHLAKARRKGKGAGVSRRLGELTAAIGQAGGIPKAFSMSEQAQFALGYWQERQSRFTTASSSGPTDDQLAKEGE